MADQFVFFLQDIQTKLNLRGSEHEHLDAKLGTILQEIQKLIPGGRKTSLEEQLRQLETSITNIIKTQREIKTETNGLSEALKLVEKERIRKAYGTVYTRWGRTTCPGNGSDVLYSGYAAGGHYKHSGASPNMLCLPDNPEWGKYDASKNSVGNYLYGVEYEMDNKRDSSIFGKPVYQQDAPCAVCEVQQRSRKLMIPGRKTCYDGWTREYWGYLMTGHYKHAATADYNCVDADPEALPGGHENQNGYLLYFVEVRCGALKCPPYVMGRELPCVVCTK